MFCNSCGAENPQDAHFCAKCGKPSISLQELAGRHLIAKSKDYAPEDINALLSAYQGAYNPKPEVLELANRLKNAYDEELLLATKKGLLRGGVGLETGNVRAAGAIESVKVEATEPFGEIVDAIATAISETFSASRFTDQFENEALSQGWTLRDALSVWYSLGHLVLVVAAWTAFNDKTRVFRILDECRPLLLKHWNLSGEMAEMLRKVVNETEAEAFKSFTSCKNGTDLSVFFSRFVSRILGAPVPFSGRSSFEDEMMGIKYQCHNPILHVTVCKFFIGICVPTKELLEKVPMI